LGVMIKKTLVLLFENYNVKFSLQEEEDKLLELDYVGQQIDEA
jgi:hypothetical protein